MHQDQESGPIAGTGVVSNDGYQLVVISGDELRVFELPREGSATIGRSEENQVRIDDPSVSRRHAVLHLGAAVVIEDLGGPNGLFVRDTTPPVVLGQVQQTQSLKRLARATAQLGVGDNLMIGAVSAVLRRRPELPALLPSSATLGGLVAQEPTMRALYEQAERAARASISVLILGETGVGKEVLARAIHACSQRAGGPFLGINCAALGEQVLEGELFGYERGAFTGAVQARPGLFEACEGGTLLLDEVGELSLVTQAKLLRVLEERTVMRIGARTLRAIDVRFLAATNRDLEAEVRAGTFRQDLFYRLNGISLTIPPLRERPLEITSLAHTFVAAASKGLERPVLEISEQAMQILRAYTWPGNVRELRNVVERAVVLCAESVVRPEHLPGSLTRREASPPPQTAGKGVERAQPASQAPVPVARDFQAQIVALERERILDALKRCGGNQTQAAKLLGMARSTLIVQLDKLDYERPRKRGK